MAEATLTEGEMVRRIAEILSRFPCRDGIDSELDELRRHEAARAIVHDLAS